MKRSASFILNWKHTRRCLHPFCRPSWTAAAQPFLPHCARPVSIHAKCTPTPRVVSNPSSVERCSGCGFAFHEQSKSQPGYLPLMKHRIRANALDITFEKYIEEFNLFELMPQSKKKYLEMKKFEKEIMALAGSGKLEYKEKEKKPLQEKESVSQLVCDRCRKLSANNIKIHMTKNRQLDVNVPLILSELENFKDAEENLKLITEEISKKKALVVAVCDILDFPLSCNVDFVNGLPPDIPVVIAATKFDLLPSETDFRSTRYRLQQYIQNDLKLQSVVDTVLISAKQDFKMETLIGSIFTHRPSTESDVYLVGCVNAGKSTLINCLMEKFGFRSRDRHTVSWIPGTTMGTLRIPFKRFNHLRDHLLERKADIVKTAKTETVSVKALKAASTSNDLNRLLTGNLIDTPGTVHPSRSLLLQLSPEEIRFASVNKPLISSHLFIRQGQCLWLSGLGRLEYVEGTAQVLLTACLPHKINYHLSTIEKADALWDANGGGKNIKWGDRLNIDWKALKEGKKLDVERKNKNKDLYAGSAVMVPPFFSTPQHYIQTLSTSQDDLGPKAGWCQDRIEMYPKFEVAWEGILEHEKHGITHGYSASHFKESIWDIVWGGLGWISISGNFSISSQRNAKFRVLTPGGQAVALRPSLFPYEVLLRGGKRPNSFLLSKGDKVAKDKYARAVNEYREKIMEGFKKTKKSAM